MKNYWDNTNHSVFQQQNNFWITILQLHVFENQELTVYTLTMNYEI